ncbi:MAG: glucosamine-6-phosphate deaminase [Acidobacteriota bacterium]
MKWEVVEDYDALSVLAAQLMLSALALKPQMVLGLPTGRTPEGMYAQVVRACHKEYHCFSSVTTFNLDEYVGILPDHPASYGTYMRSRLFDHVDLDPSRRNIPDGLATAIRRDHPRLTLDEALPLECTRYEQAIAGAGLDLTFLGLGTNGHIGFNEPGGSFESRTRVVRLSESTRKANASFFGEDSVPDRAITMGIATILSSKQIIVMASGTKKASIVRRLEQEPASEDLPASSLRRHPDVTVIVDNAAAAELS